MDIAFCTMSYEVNFSIGIVPEPGRGLDVVRCVFQFIIAEFDLFPPSILRSALDALCTADLFASLIGGMQPPRYALSFSPKALLILVCHMKMLNWRLSMLYRAN